MTNRETMQQALECIERLNAHGWILADYEDEVYAAIAALKAALEQPEQEPVAHPVIVGALFDFMGWLTSRKERLALSSVDDASPAVDAITDFAKMRGLSLDDARVLDWNTSPKRTEQEPVAFYHPRSGFYWAKPTSIFAPTSVDVEPLPLYAAAERNNG